MSGLDLLWWLGRRRNGGGLPAPAFSPSDDAGVFGWWDAASPGSLTLSGSDVTSWASLVGGASLGQGLSANRPVTGARTLGGRNVLDFAAAQSDVLSGLVNFPASGNFAMHLVAEVDSVASAFAALVSFQNGADWQLDAGVDGQFAGRLNPRLIGDTVALTGGPFAGARLFSILFNRSGSVYQIFVDRVLRGSGAYSANVDTGGTIRLMTNRSVNAWVDGSIAEMIFTSSLGNRASYETYLSGRWGVAP